MPPARSGNAIEARFRGRRGRFNLDVDFTCPARGVTALFGPSGCGKTTVLRCIAGLDRLPDGYLVVNGAVWQDGADSVPTHRRPLGYVFQEASLFPHMSVRANLVYGQKRARAQSGLDVEEVAGLLGLNALLDRAPGHLSGGERQRVAIGRALLSAPEILLMDEPLASLDRFAKNDILPYLERLHDELAIPILYVSHDIAEVERLADRMVLMETGHVRASGPTESLLADPDLPFARQPDAASVLVGTVAAHDPDYGLTSLRVNDTVFFVPGAVGETGSRHRLRIVASDVALCRPPLPEGLSILNAPSARIIDIQPAGKHQVTVFLAIGPAGDGAVLLSHITRKSCDALALKTGDRVHALIKSAALLSEA